MFWKQSGKLCARYDSKYRKDIYKNERPGDDPALEPFASLYGDKWTRTLVVTAGKARAKRVGRPGNGFQVLPMRSSWERVYGPDVVHWALPQIAMYGRKELWEMTEPGATRKGTQEPGTKCMDGKRMIRQYYSQNWNEREKVESRMDREVQS